MICAEELALIEEMLPELVKDVLRGDDDSEV